MDFITPLPHVPRIPSPSLRDEGQGAEQGIGADPHRRGCQTPSGPRHGAPAKPRALLQSRPCTFISLRTWLCAFITLFRYFSTQREEPPLRGRDSIWQTPLFSLSNSTLGEHLLLHNGPLGPGSRTRPWYFSGCVLNFETAFGRLKPSFLSQHIAALIADTLKMLEVQLWV